MTKFSKEKVAGAAVINKELTENDIDTIIVTSFEGGSTYWMGLDNAKPEWKDKPKGEPLSQWATKLLLEGKTVHLYDIEDEEERFELTLEKILKGFALNATKRPWDCDLETGDAETADCIVQYALFDQVVYG